MKGIVMRGLLGLLLAASAAAMAAAGQPERGGEGGLPRLDVPRAAQAPTIDGDVADAVWAGAARIDGLLPAAKAGPADRELRSTVVRALWDTNALYVAFDCEDDEVFSTGTLKHDDNVYLEDVVEVFLDGFGDGRQFVEIQVAPDGTTLDMMYLLTAEMKLAPDGRIAPDVSRRDRWGFREWEMEGLQAAAKRTARGWSAEVAIPAGPVVKRRGTSVFEPGEIRAQFMRYDHVPVEGKASRRLIQQNWSPVIHGNPHNTPSRMGRLVLIDDQPTTRP